MPRSKPPAPADSAVDEPTAMAHAASRVAGLVDDLPFIPLKPYEKRWLQIGWRAAIIVLLAGLAYFRSVGGEWLWQDERLATDLAIRTTHGLGAIWAHPLASELSPGARTLAWLAFHSPAGGPVGFRVLNLILHVTTCLFGWFIMRRLAVPGAWLAAAAVAVHPALLPTVAWPSRQGDLLAAAASAGAVWAYLAGRRVRPYVSERIWTDPSYHDDEDYLPRWPWVFVGVFATVALTCGSAIPVLAAAGLLAVERLRRRPRRGVWAALVGFIVLATGARAMLPHAASPLQPYASVPAISVAAEATTALPWAALHAFAPAEIAFIYDRTQWANVAVLATGALLTLAAIAAAFRWRRPWPLLLAATGLYAVVHGATAGRPSAPAVAAADLMPYGVIALLLPAAVAAAVARIPRRTEHADRPWKWGGGAVLMICLGALTVSRAPAYTEADRLWLHSLVLNPDSVIARQELAAHFVAEDYLEEAGIQLDRVPDSKRDVAWLLARGQLFDAQKRYTEAVACYESAHAQRPDDILTTTTLAEAQNNAGRSDRAAELYDALLRRVTNDPNLYTNAGLTQMRLARPDAAIALYESALKLNADYIPAHINLANALFEAKKFPEAAEHLQRVVAIDPRNYVAFMNAGVMLYQLGDPVKAERMFRSALSINRTPDAYRKLATTLAAQKKTAEATWSLGQANRLESENPNAQP